MSTVRASEWVLAKSDFVRNLRLVAATLLLSVWGFAHLAWTPVLGETILPLLLALLVAPKTGFGHWGTDKAAALAMLVALVALFALTALMFAFGTEPSLVAFAHSPYFVLPIWTLGLIGLARNATSAERSEAASAAAESAGAHATDAG